MSAAPFNHHSFDNQSHGSSTSPTICSTCLPLTLLGRCFLFLNLKELHATQSVSHIFYEASHDPSAWKENTTLPSSFHYSTFPSPRIHLRSSTPLVQLEAIRSSPHSFGRSARWLEVTTSVPEFSDIRQMIEQESRNLDGLIIRNVGAPQPQQPQQRQPFVETPGTRHRPFQSLVEMSVVNDLIGRNITTPSAYQSITCLPEYLSKTFEELRCEDEALGGIQTYHTSPTTSFDTITGACLRVLSIDNVHEHFMADLLPVISAIHSLEVLEFELSDIRDMKEAYAYSNFTYSLPTSFATSLARLKKLQTLALSDRVYRRAVINGVPSTHERIVFLSHESLGILQTLVTLASQIIRIELCLFLECSYLPIRTDQISSAIPLPQVRTLAMRSSLVYPEMHRKLYDVFPCLTHIIDVPPNTMLDACSTQPGFLHLLPASITELTLARFHAPMPNPPPPLLRLRRLTVHHLTLKPPNRFLVKEPVMMIFGHLEEFHFHSIDHPSSMACFVDLLKFMPNLRISNFPFSCDYYEFNDSTLKDYLATRFSALKQLHILYQEGDFRSLYDVKELIESIPQLKEVKWNNEPWLSVDQLESYYSWANIDKRQKQSLNLDHLDRIQPILQQINSSSLPNHIHLNLFSLTLIFQFLTPMDLFSTHRVCRSYRVAAVSPLVLRPNIRVRIDHEEGVIVSGTQVSFTAIKPMLSAVRSMLFQNIRILTLPDPLESALKLLPREPDFYHHYLDRFKLIPSFHSLHTLSLDWSSYGNKVDESMTDQDLELIDQVFQSATLKHLKVLKLVMSSNLMQLMITKWIRYLNELEMIEMNCNSSHSMMASTLPFSQLSQMPSLKLVYTNHIIPYGPHRHDLLQLHELCQLSRSIESIHCKTFIDDNSIPMVNDQPITFTHHWHSVRATVENLSALDLLNRAFPSLTDLTLSLHHGFSSGPDGHDRSAEAKLLARPPTGVTLPTRWCHQLLILDVLFSDVATLSTLMDVFIQTLTTVPEWSRLEQFGLIRGSYSLPATFPTSQLTTVLRSMPHLTDLALEGVEFPMDLDPHPWIGRLHRFRHSDEKQLIRLLPHAHQLIQFRTQYAFDPDSSDARALLASLLLPSHLNEIIFGDLHFTQSQLRDEIKKRTPIMNQQPSNNNSQDLSTT